MDLKSVQLENKKVWNGKRAVEFTLGFEIR
jgi:hypothetical protein